MAKKRWKVTYHVEERSKISGVVFPCPRTGVSRQKIIKRHVRPGIRLVPRLEPDNPHDPNAIGLWLRAGWFIFKRWYHIGYIGRSRAEHLATLMREGKKLSIIVSNVTGGKGKKQTRGVNILIQYQ